MEPIQRIMIRAQVFGQCLRVNRSIEHPAQGHAIDNTAVNGKADDPPRELIHYHQDPVGS